MLLTFIILLFFCINSGSHLVFLWNKSKEFGSQRHHKQTTNNIRREENVSREGLGSLKLCSFSFASVFQSIIIPHQEFLMLGYGFCVASFKVRISGQNGPNAKVHCTPTVQRHAGRVDWSFLNRFLLKKSPPLTGWSPLSKCGSYIAQNATKLTAVWSDTQ